jgi:glycosyltransferase involved in cell wall biosynthesis
LANILQELAQRKKYTIKLLTSKTEGCLSGIEGVIYYNNYYKWENSRIALACRFIIAQLYILFFILFHEKTIDIIYINTALPFSAAIAGRLTGKKIIYHVHELYLHPNIIQKYMFNLMLKNASKIICVSEYVRQNIENDSLVIYNAVSREFEQRAMKYIESGNIRHKYYKKNILMLSSLKKYKGINIFIDLAKSLPCYRFSLVISSTRIDIDRYFINMDIPKNLHIIPWQVDLFLYYVDASIVINLSLPDLWVETFGMTLLEGIQFGTPVIAPSFGGPKEIIVNGKNGFLVNPYKKYDVIRAINTIMESEHQYVQFLENSLDMKNKFSIDNSIGKVMLLIDSFSGQL